MNGSDHLPKGQPNKDLRRKLGARCTVWVFLSASLLTLLPRALPAEPTPSFEADFKAATEGYRATRLINKPISNDRSEIVGNLEDIILGADGKANFALIDAGSVSLGPHIVVIPFERLKIDKDQGSIILPGAAKADLQKLAVFP